jgi:hypothetical protein
MIRKNLVIEITMCQDFINVVVISMKLVVRPFVPDPQKDEGGTSHAYH